MIIRGILATFRGNRGVFGFKLNSLDFSTGLEEPSVS